MKIDKYINKGNKRLILFYSGWASNPQTFHRIKSSDSDVWICYDYTFLYKPEGLEKYNEIHLIAWSLGVWASCQTVADIPFTSATAINGTPLPVDNIMGIPTNIFKGTYETLSVENLQRFNQRMCGNKTILEEFLHFPCTRDIEELRNELISIQQAKVLSDTQLFTHAIISTNDRIFPSNNLSNYWKNKCHVTEIDAPHYPFYLWTEWRELWK